MGLLHLKPMLPATGVKSGEVWSGDERFKLKRDFPTTTNNNNYHYYYIHTAWKNSLLNYAIPSNWPYNHCLIIAPAWSVTFDHQHCIANGATSGLDHSTLSKRQICVQSRLRDQFIEGPWIIVMIVIWREGVSLSSSFSSILIIQIN